MKLGTVAKIFVGIGTSLMIVLPVTMIMFYLAYFMSIFPMIALSERYESIPAFIIIAPVLFITAAVFIQCFYFGLRILMVIFYLIHVILNRSGKDLVRVLCAIGFCFLPFIAMPVYYIIYILKAEPPEWSLQVQAQPA